MQSEHIPAREPRVRPKHYFMSKKLEAFIEHLSPSNLFVVVLIGLVMFFSAGTLLVKMSLAFSVEVPAQGGTHTEGIVGSPRFINPLLALSDADRSLTRLVYAGLTKMGSGGVPVPHLASSYTISEDGKTYTFTLREDALFHDGTPITAEDVVFTIHLAQDPNIKSSLRANWEGIVVEAPDARTVVFTLKAPYAPFIGNTTLGILPRALWERITSDEFPFTTLNTKPIGAGPYRVEEVKVNAGGIPSEYRLRAWRKGASTPYIERFVFKFYKNSEELAAAGDAGIITAAHSLPTLKGAHHEAILGRVFAIFFNQNQNALFTDPIVRDALNTAIDKQTIVEEILGGYGSALSGPLPKAEQVSEEESQDEGGSLVLFGVDENITVARAKLEKAGFTLGKDNVYVKTVKKQETRLSFSLATGNDPELKAVAERVANTWRALGVEVDLQIFEENDLSLSVIRPRKYDALLFGLVVGNDPDLYAFWHSSQRNDPGLNVGLYASVAADKKLESARAAIEPSERHALTEDAAQLIAKETAAIFLYAPHFLYITPQTLQGVSFDLIATPSDRLIHADTWYLAKERRWPFFMSH